VDVASKSEAAKELPHLHFRLGHVNFKALVWMIRSGKVQVQSSMPVTNVHPFHEHAACVFGEDCRQGSDATSTNRNPNKETDLKKGDLFARQ